HSRLPVNSSLSLHDALPIWTAAGSKDTVCCRPLLVLVTTYSSGPGARWAGKTRRSPGEIARPLGTDRLTWLSPPASGAARVVRPDRKSTRLNSSHVSTSYAV